MRQEQANVGLVPVYCPTALKIGQSGYAKTLSDTRKFPKIPCILRHRPSTGRLKYKLSMENENISVKLKQWIVFDRPQAEVAVCDEFHFCGG